MSNEFSIFFNLTTSKMPINWFRDGKPVTDAMAAAYVHSLEMAHCETYFYHNSERSWK